MQHASIRITPRQIALVRESFAKIVPIREAAAALFYSRLFASNPGTRPLFRGDIKSQGVKLMAAIGAVVNSLDRIDTMQPQPFPRSRRKSSRETAPKERSSTYSCSKRDCS